MRRIRLPIGKALLAAAIPLLAAPGAARADDPILEAKNAIDQRMMEEYSAGARLDRLDDLKADLPKLRAMNTETTRLLDLFPPGNPLTDAKRIRSFCLDDEIFEPNRDPFKELRTQAHALRNTSYLFSFGKFERKQLPDFERFTNYEAEDDPQYLQLLSYLRKRCKDVIAGHDPKGVWLADFWRGLDMARQLISELSADIEHLIVRYYALNNAYFAELSYLFCPPPVSPNPSPAATNLAKAVGTADQKLIGSAPPPQPKPPAPTVYRPVPEKPGAICQYGGTKTLSGADSNGNGSLEDSEVTAIGYDCAKAPAAPPPPPGASDVQKVKNAVDWLMKQPSLTLEQIAASLKEAPQIDLTSADIPASLIRKPEDLLKQFGLANGKPSNQVSAAWLIAAIGFSKLKHPTQDLLTQDLLKVKDRMTEISEALDDSSTWRSPGAKLPDQDLRMRIWIFITANWQRAQEPKSPLPGSFSTDCVEHARLEYPTIFPNASSAKMLCLGSRNDMPVQCYNAVRLNGNNHDTAMVLCHNAATSSGSLSCFKPKTASGDWNWFVTLTMCSGK